MDIKNILLVPLIFKEIYKTNKNVQFWLIGDGKRRKEVEELSKGLPITFWGNVSPEVMPDYLNCTDVLILPSRNEGLPLIIVEALQCGCHVVGSDVGGIPEVLGKKNCVSLDNKNFVKEFASKVQYYLNEDKKEDQELPTSFDWNVTAIKEKKIIDKILSL